MYYVYALKSLNKRYIYVGMTKSLRRRVKQHNAGKTKSLKGYIPLELFFREEYETAEEARKMELYYKSGIGKEILWKVWNKKE